MNSELKVTLDLCHFRSRISGRMKEIENSVYYHKINDEPEILLFTIDDTGGNIDERIMDMIEEASSGIISFSFLANGFVKRTPDKKHGLSIKVEASPGTGEFCSRLEKLMSSGGITFQSCINGNGELYIPVMDYPGFLDTEIIWRHIPPNSVGLAAKILSLYPKKPAYKIRNFLLPAEGFRIELHDEKGLLKVYDLLLRRWINRKNTGKSGEGFEKFRIVKGYEMPAPAHTKDSEIFLSSDLHMGHQGIIEGASRPFLPGEVEKMDEVLTQNWNYTVKPSDRVFYLGDLTYNSGPGTCEKYLSGLNGEMIFIRGNHDVCMNDSPDRYILEYLDREFHLVHDPKKRPEDHSEWMIHGHVHNSRICDYPFIDFRNKTINVCCELTSYRPVNLRDIVRILDLHEKGRIRDKRIMLFDEVLNLLNENPG